MKRKTILTVGDSTSMTIGAERQMYLFYLADMRSWAQGSRILNCSLPGFTSADACAFFFRNKKHFEQLSAVIIYLGNCDAMSSELRKGKYTPLRQWTDSIAGKKKSKTKLKNKFLYFEWNNNFDSTIEAPESPQDYEYNIARMVSDCKQMDVPVILIRPQANTLFPSGVGKGNFIFYKYLGISDRIADRVSIEDSRFKDALSLQENREFNAALEVYKNILLETGPLSANLEYQNIIVNNYAVCAAQAGFLEEAEYLLNLLRKERGIRKEIILYNLAQVVKLKGDMPRYKLLLGESCEADGSMYRIREPYKLAIDRISRAFKNTSVIDLKDFVAQDDYVDHCHPLAPAQELLAKRIAESLQIPALKGDNPLVIENRLYNPEYALGNLAEFYTYFKTFASFSSDEIKNNIGELMVSAANDKVPPEILKAVEYYRGHPCFPGLRDIMLACPSYPMDVGRFPEFFIIRYLVPYLRIIEKTPQLSGLFSPEAGILRSSKEFVLILPSLNGVEETEPVFDLEYERERLPAILHKVRTMLIEHLEKGNQVHNRLKTTIFWYFREALRFGSHSRISMRYERIPLEFMAEGLAVAGVINLKINGKMNSQIQSMIGYLEETLRTHEYFCRKFSLERDCEDVLKQYDEKLTAIAKEIKDVFSLRFDLEREHVKCIS